MEIFNLPNTASVNKVIPKNTFDSYTSSKQKKLFSELISRITWTHKISTDTVNLIAKEIKEIQVFRIELKQKQDVQQVLDLIDKLIPYNIIFVIDYDGMIYLSTSVKHPHPANDDNTVIDWTFKTDWFHPIECSYTLSLKKNIDSVYHDFCVQLTGKNKLVEKSLSDVIAFKKVEKSIKSEISNLKSKIANCNQFNKKVEMNLQLRVFERKLEELQS